MMPNTLNIYLYIYLIFAYPCLHHPCTQHVVGRTASAICMEYLEKRKEGINGGDIGGVRNECQNSAKLFTLQMFHSNFLAQIIALR